MTQPADHRRAWRCPACEQAIHYIDGQDPIAMHAPHCESIPGGTSAPSAITALRAIDQAVRQG